MIRKKWLRGKKIDTSHKPCIHLLYKEYISYLYIGEPESAKQIFQMNIERRPYIGTKNKQ